MTHPYLRKAKPRVAVYPSYPTGHNKPGYCTYIPLGWPNKAI